MCGGQKPARKHVGRRSSCTRKNFLLRTVVHVECMGQARETSPVGSWGGRLKASVQSSVVQNVKTCPKASRGPYSIPQQAISFSGCVTGMKSLIWKQERGAESTISFCYLGSSIRVLPSKEVQRCRGRRWGMQNWN